MITIEMVFEKVTESNIRDIFGVPVSEKRKSYRAG